MPTKKVHFWEDEKPITVEVGDKYVIEYFPRARKLSIGKGNWVNDAGEKKRGKTIVLDLATLTENQAAVKLLMNALETCKN